MLFFTLPNTPAKRKSSALGDRSFPASFERSSPTFTPALPPELWSRIFRFSCSPPSHKAYWSEYSPFHQDAHASSRGFTPTGLPMKRTLVLVCKHWRALGMRFLMEDVIITQGAFGFVAGLKRSAELLGSAGYGRFVRRLELSLPLIEPDLSKVQSPNSLLTDIIKYCPHVEVIFKRERIVVNKDIAPVSESSTPEELTPQIESLQRLDWWYSHDAARSEGLGFLDDFLSRTPNLRYLFVEGWLPHHAYKVVDPRKTILPHLETLRIGRIDSAMLWCITEWTMPKLANIIADPAAFGCLKGVLRVFGQRVRTVELTQHTGFFCEPFLHDILIDCPKLEELNYYAEYTLPSKDHKGPHRSLRKVCIKAMPNQKLQDFNDDGQTIWRVIGGHFTMYMSEARFPVLERIVLYGDWSSLVTDARFHPLHVGLSTRGCLLEYPDGILVQPLCCR